MRRCTCDDPNLIPVKDGNLDVPYKDGNPYARYCTNCERRYFCAKSFFQKAAEKFLIPEGSNEPVHYFECPKCGADQTGEPDCCTDCGVEYEWDD